VLHCALVACALTAWPLEKTPADIRSAWIALLHYDLRGRASEVSDPDFFLAPDGRINADAEWRAELSAFKDPVGATEPDRHAQCRFPARFDLMKEQLHWTDTDVPSVICPKLNEHRRNLRASSVSVVFMSYSFSNPASAFGHLLLLLESGQEGSLLDRAVSFDASIEGMAPIEYLVRGLIGNLDAGYHVRPFSEHVQRYQREEQRDAWLFPLALAPDKIGLLISHLWELEGVDFPYDFVRGNCAQKLLALIHAIAPEYELLAETSTAVLPFEVARRLTSRISLSDPIRQRPSLVTEYAHMRSRLTTDENNMLDRITATRTLVPGASEQVLLTALIWAEIESPDGAFRRTTETEENATTTWRRQVWNALVDAPELTNDQVVLGGGEGLLSAHAPSRFSLRAGVDTRGATMGLGVRWLLHDALDPPTGYPDLSSIEVGKVEVSFVAEGGLQVDEVTAVRVEKLSSGVRAHASPAWKAEIGARQFPKAGGQALNIGFEFGYGASIPMGHLGHSAVTGYTLFSLRPGVDVSKEGRSGELLGLWSGGIQGPIPHLGRSRISCDYARRASSPAAGLLACAFQLRWSMARDSDVGMSVSRAVGRTSLALTISKFH
jgi:hypothetical protein